MTFEKQAPKWLYLHGFASGPESAKGRALSTHYAARGQAMARLDLRIPSLERLRLGAMIDHVRARIGGERDRAVLFGSSLGGLTAARVAERDARVSALVLLAPAFRIAERWRRRIGDEAWRRWKDSGWLEVDDHATGKKARVDFGFVEEAAAVDADGGGCPDVRVPTLVVHGVHDDVVDIALLCEWARGRHHVRLVEVDDGHELVRSLDVIAREADAHLAGYLVTPPLDV
jgi:pimeloyl-ACP methyl ester carboxylesterase